MLVETAKWIIILFGIFLILVGFMMLFKPNTALDTLKKAGSTPFINYAEITIRMIPAAAMVIYSEYSLFPQFLNLLGWFMLGTSFILYFVPIKLHHNFALKSAENLNPLIVRFISLPSFLFGGFMFCTVWF